MIGVGNSWRCCFPIEDFHSVCAELGALAKRSGIRQARRKLDGLSVDPSTSHASGRGHRETQGAGAEHP